MKKHLMLARNGDEFAIYEDDRQHYACPVCAYWWPNAPAMWPIDVPLDGDTTGHVAAGNWDICPRCGTEFEVDDCVTDSSPPGTYVARLEALRVRWLDAQEWSEDALAFVKEIGVDVDDLLRRCGKRRSI